MAAKRKGGRPPKITAEVKADIVAGMAGGKTLLEMCAKHDVARENVWRARQRDLEFDDAFTTAANNGIVAYLDIAKQNLANATTRDDILKYKELLRHAEWMAEKRLAMFQPTQRAVVEHTGPMVIGWKTIEGEATEVSDGVLRNGRARPLTIEASASPIDD